MTRTEAGYEATRDALAILERMLASMTRRRAEFGKNFHFYAEGVVEEILKLRAEIDGYTGLTAYLAEFGPPPPIDEPASPLANGSANGTAGVSPPAAAPAT